MQYNDWTVLGKSTKRKYFLLCRCVCGTVKDVRKCALVGNTSKSCGCRMSRVCEGYGYVGTRTYNCYGNMLQRCYNKNNPGYHNYGGRGITVSDEWRTSFKSFIRDMGVCPSNDHSIERVNNDDGYKKENCKWATRAEQRRNTRNSIKITYNGETLTQQDWSMKLFGNKHTVRARMLRGWSAEKSLSTPQTGIREKCHAKRITFNGETRTILQWAEHLGISKSLMKMRIKMWPIERALTTRTVRKLTKRCQKRVEE